MTLWQLLQDKKQKKANLILNILFNTMKQKRRRAWVKLDSLCRVLYQTRVCDIGFVSGKFSALRYKVRGNTSNTTYCFYCGHHFNYFCKRTVDHVMPKSLGGLHKSFNTVFACNLCNQSKGNLLLHEWVNRLSPKSHVRRRLLQWGPRVCGFDYKRLVRGKF